MLLLEGPGMLEFAGLCIFCMCCTFFFSWQQANKHLVSRILVLRIFIFMGKMHLGKQVRSLSFLSVSFEHSAYEVLSDHLEVISFIPRSSFTLSLVPSIIQAHIWGVIAFKLGILGLVHRISALGPPTLF